MHKALAAACDLRMANCALPVLALGKRGEQTIERYRLTGDA